MHILGLQKTTLLDYPGQVACTVFTAGCNFRCPFCHNAEIIEPEKYHVAQEYSEDEIWDFLKKRRHTLGGVCISGGEPTLQPDLAEFMGHVHDLGLLVKLDSNGYKPDILKDLVRGGYVDYIAMDIKSSRANYFKVAGVGSIDIDRIDESIRFLIDGSLPYEFRTTVVKGLHHTDDFYDIAVWLSGAQRYYLQMYTESEYVLEPGFEAFTTEEMEAWLPVLSQNIKQVELRGIDYEAKQ